MNAEKWLVENIDIVIRGIEETKTHNQGEAWSAIVNHEIDDEEYERRCRLATKERDVKLKEVQKLINNLTEASFIEEVS